MRRTTPLTAAVLLGLALSMHSPTTAATAAAATCRGEAATIVGTTPTLTGTEGRDVVVTGKASDVFTLGGDDLICVVPDRTGSNLVDVDAGTGNDVVDTTGTRGGYYVDVILGAGADTFVGGKASDTVTTGSGEKPMVDQETDTVTTGGAGDTVITGSAGSTNHDVVATGSGRDIVVLASTAAAADAVLSGGAGEDALRLTVPSGDVDADVEDGTLTTPAGTAPFSSFELLGLSVGSGTVTYRGTEGDDSLTVHPTTGVPVLDIATGRGDDEIAVEPATLAAGSRIDAGRGDDTFVAARRTGSIELDLKYSRVAIDGAPVATATGLEHGFLMAPDVMMGGLNGDNSLSFNGCNATLHGRNGDDYLTQVGDYWFDSYTFDCTATAQMYGGPGKDHLRGGSGNDTLHGEGGKDRIEGRGGNDRIRGGGGNDRMDGGEGRDNIRGDQGNDTLLGRAADDVLFGGGGRDVADGSRGRDRCVAEQERRCER